MRPTLSPRAPRLPAADVRADALTTTLTTDEGPGVGAAASSPLVADTLHDLLVRLLDDRELAGFAARSVALRAAARVRDGLAPTLDAPALLAAAHEHATGLARVGAVPSTVDAVTDRLVLDLLLRRGLDPREVARITGVPQPAQDARRARAVAVLAAETDTDIRAAEVAYADGPVDRAPTAVRQTVLEALASATPDDVTRRAAFVRVLGIATATVVALGALAAGTPVLVAERTPSPPRVEAVPTTDAPLSSTVARDRDGGADDEQTDADATDADVTDAEVTDADGPLLDRLPTDD